MEQTSDKRNLGAEVKDKRRANADEEGSARPREERIQNEAQLSDQRLIPSSVEDDPGESSKQTNANPSNEPEGSSLQFFSLKMYLQRSASSASITSDTLSSSQQSNIVDCAGMVLNCLFCRFYDLFNMVPDSCGRLVNHCCPNYKHIMTTMESTPSNEEDMCIDLDCGLFNSCHDAGDCLELAMEVSELCYH